jgi:hypothetical protein
MSTTSIITTGCDGVDDGREQPPPFFGAFPTRGIWTALSMSRAQFAGILVASIAAFVFIDGPLWRHLEANHFRRIVVSYLSIPLLILACQLTGGRFDLPSLFGGSLVIGVLKLLVTALMVLLMSY